VNDIRIGDHVENPSGRTGQVTAPDGALHVWVAYQGEPGVEHRMLTSRLRLRKNGGRS
jgi:hypothetical protein